jgi:hypothetical protein
MLFGVLILLSFQLIKSNVLVPKVEIKKFVENNEHH